MPSARVEAAGRMVISLRDESIWAAAPVEDVLRCCFDHVEREVISKLKQFFSAITTTGKEGARLYSKELWVTGIAFNFLKSSQGDEYQ